MISTLKNQDEIPYDLLLLADDTREAIDRYIFDSEIMVYKKGGKTIAVYVLQNINKETAEIKNIAVAEPHQCKGIGTMLINDAIGRARKSGYKHLDIGTGDASYIPLALYQKLGFEIYNSKKQFFLDNYPEPVIENGIQLIDMVMLRMEL